MASKIPSLRMGYEAAGTGRRLGNWQPGNDSVNALLFQDADLIRARSRDLVRRNAWASNAIDSLQSNIVGTGIKPRPTVNDEQLRDQIVTAWNRWTHEADAHGMLDFYGLQSLAVRAMVEGGEVLVRLRNRLPSDGLSVPLQIQLLEPEHLPSSLNQTLPNGNIIRSGIEFDKIAQRTAYHLYREHPGERSLYGGFNSTPVPVPASEIIHMMKVGRPGQLRGEPWITQAIIKLHELDQYDDAELVRKKAAALIAGFIKTPAPEYATDNTVDDVDDYGVMNTVWTPGTLQVLREGEEITFSEPADVGGSYEPFMRFQLRAIAVAIGVTYEQLTGDLTGVNYSSIRAGMVEFRRRMEQLQQNVIIHQFCRPIFARWMDQAVLSGALKIPGYVKNKHIYQSAKWIAQGWAWVDPQKEFNAVIMAIRSGLLSREAALATYGFDAEEMDRVIAISNNRADRLGIILDSDPRYRTKTGAAIPPDPSKKPAQQDAQTTPSTEGVSFSGEDF
ncbi:MAG: phage portal protein [Magnetococcales bacterium]|nr:phage portal protein [Magnetococcales bacterium]